MLENKNKNTHTHEIKVKKIEGQHLLKMNDR